jgi:hypothetical protein
MAENECPLGKSNDGYKRISYRRTRNNEVGSVTRNTILVDTKSEDLGLSWW